MLICVWALFVSVVHVVSLFAPLVGLDIGESVKGLGFLFFRMLNTLMMVTCIHIYVFDVLKSVKWKYLESRKSSFINPPNQ